MIETLNNMANNNCNVCEKFVRSSHAYVCNVCSRKSHAKCLGIQSKFFQDVWMCNICRQDVFPFSSFEPELTKLGGGNDLRGFKSLFQKLNSISDFNCLNDTNDISTSINCKYYTCDEFNSLSSKASLSFFHTNIASLSKHFDELSSLLLNLNHSFDIIGITETKLNSSNSDNHLLLNYSFVHTPSASLAGGTGLYISNKHTFKLRNDLSEILYYSGSLESIFIELIFKSTKNIIVGCVYKHPHFDINDFNEFYLSPLLSKVNSENKTILLLGDFNINLLNCETIKSHSDFLDLFGSFYMLPCITLPTRLTSQSSTLIDNIFLSPFSDDIISGNLTVSLSDHLPQFLILYKPSSKKLSPNNIHSRNWSKFDHNSFRRDFDNISWNEILALEKNDCEESFNSFLNELNSLIDIHAPIKKLSKRQLKLATKPWITKGILTSMKIRDNLFREYLESSSPNIKIFLHSRYKQYRNRIVSLLRTSKKLYYRQYFNNNLNNLSNIWKGIREIISLKPSSSNTIISLQINDSICSNPLTVAETFNDYFTSVADKVREEIPFTSHHFSEWLPQSKPSSFFIQPVSPNEVSKIILGLKKGKSSGPNSIPYPILSNISNSLSPILSKLINLSFTTGIYPSKLKEAKVIPVFKKGSPTLVENYRPISLLSNIDKIIQKLMHSRISKFLDKFNIIYSRQFGFRSNHSTTYALIMSIEQIYKAVDSGNYACSVFIDLKKAFDTVDHSILLSKLRNYGICGVALSWFLSSRKQFVSVSGINSSSKHVPHGVPQGSVLGPLLFLLYINDLKNAIPFSTVNLFADDTMLSNHNISLKSLTNKIIIDLKCLTNWLNANKISLNASKTELLIFSPKRKTTTFVSKIKINGKQIFPSTSVNYLGVLIDSKLSWNAHLNLVCTKLRRANGALCKIRHYVPKNLLLSLYYALFHSHMSYSCQVWAQRQNNQTSRILTLQKRALRIISFSDYNSPSSPLFLQFKILSFFDFVKFLNIILIFKSLNNMLPDSLTDVLNLTPLTVNARTSHHPSRLKRGILLLPRTSTISYGNFSIRYQSILSWNILQNFLNIDNLSTLSYSKLKFLIKSYYLSSYV